MAHVQRYRSGPTSFVGGKILAADVVEVGDLVAQVGNYMKDYTLSGLTAVTFHAAFIGVVVQGGTQGGETVDTACLVQDTGEFEFPTSVAVATYAPAGTLVSASGPQQVTILAAGTYGSAVGRLAKPANVGDLTVLVRLNSTVMSPTAVTPA